MSIAMGSGGTSSAATDAGVMAPSAGGSDSGAMTGSGGNAGGNVHIDAGPPLPDFTLQVDTPDDGASVSGNVKVSGRAPGFLNVEVWDAMHQNPPLAQVKPDDDGRFELTVNTSGLAAGATTWTVYAWDSPPGEDFDHTQNVPLSLTIGSTSSGSGAPSNGNDGTPDPGNAYVPAGYTLVFSDEFSGSSLDMQKWNTLGPWGVQFFTDSKQKQAFVPEAVSVHDGIVSFSADHANGASSANGQPYTSGSITTNGTFTHGYFEARVKLPQGKGFWPAYWVTSSTRWPPEWDIFEIIDNVIYGYPHPIDSGKCQFVEGAAGGDSTYQIDNLYGIYHVYGFKWTATDIYWYVDGTLTEHYAIDGAAGANDTYWLNLSFQIGGDWPGDPDGSTPFPAHMDVDYVRVYQQK
jgi:beta-glucanase (GH16 family)